MRNGNRWFFTIVGFVILATGSTWAYTILTERRVTKVETRVNGLESKIEEVKMEQRALRDRTDKGFRDVLNAIREIDKSP